MNLKLRRAQYGRVFLLLLLVWTAAARSASGQAARNLPAFKLGEIILYMQPATPAADLNAVTATVNTDQVIPLGLADCYLVVLKAAEHTEAATLNAIAQLKLDRRVRWVGPNSYRYSTQAATPNAPKTEPNDPRYKSGEQWGLALINMPYAWTLQQGAPNINLAWIDSGYDPLHVDAKNVFLPESFDLTTGMPNITADGIDPMTMMVDDHGTGTFSVALANTDNNIGIAGICWKNIKCLALKGTPRGGSGFAVATLIQGYNFITQNKDKLHLVALNLSLGGAGDPNDTNNPEYVALKAVADTGIIVIVSAGNDARDNHLTVPAGFSFVTTVSAVGRTGKLATYSSFGKVDIAAPGGDQDATGNLSDGILTHAQNSLYHFEQGTSFASPHVAGVVGLLMSVPGVTPAQAVQALKSTANKSGLGTLPDPKYGYGLLDAFAALVQVSVSVSIQDPVGVDAQGRTTDPSGVAPPIETFKPTLRITISNIPFRDPSLVIKLDGQTIPLSQFTIESGDATSSTPHYTIVLRKQFPNTAPFQHTLTVTGTSPATGTSTTDVRTFTISPYSLPAGQSFISIPYYESAADSPITGQYRNAIDLLGRDVTLFRWVNTTLVTTQGATAVQGRYAQAGKPPVDPTTGQPLPPDPLAAYASFLPPDTLGPGQTSLITPDPRSSPSLTTTATDVRPLGLAYFINATASVPVITNGLSFPTQAIRVPLHEGWNMVGDPYPYAVSFNTTEVETNSGARFTVQQSVDQGLLLPYIFRLIAGQYSFATLPSGAFQPWEGHWIYVVPKDKTNLNAGNVLTLIISPNRAVGGGSASGRAASANALPSVSGQGSWSLRLVARTKDLVDGHNFIGMSTRATDGEDVTKVPKPPLLAPFVSLAIARSGSAAGLYAQDLRPLGGVKTWEVVVTTDQLNSAVTLSWPEGTGLPKSTRLLLTDKTTGQSVDMQKQSSYAFNSGKSADPRSFQVTARPTSASGHPVISNVFVNPSRSAGGRDVPTYQIGYSLSGDASVQITVLSSTGQVIAEVGNGRAVSSGNNVAVWNGRDKSGRPVPGGTYLLHMQAMTSDGMNTRQVNPFVITR